MMKSVAIGVLNWLDELGRNGRTEIRLTSLVAIGVLNGLVETGRNWRTGIPENSVVVLSCLESVSTPSSFRPLDEMIVSLASVVDRRQTWSCFDLDDELNSFVEF